MSIAQPDVGKAQALNRDILAAAAQTAQHQSDEKIVALILAHQVDSPTLAAATASLQFNSELLITEIDRIRRTMKIMLDAQMVGEELAAARRTSDLMIDQIKSQKMLAESSEKQAKASNFLAWVNIGLATVGALFTVVQAYIAVKEWHP